jgi:protein-disulfide isomerase
VALGAVSVVIAAVVIFSSGGSTTRPEDPEAKLRAGGQSLIVGNPDAPTKVTVFEDFGDPHSRDFEIASRDFLQVEAAQGDVQVEYRPFYLEVGYSLWALHAWGAVLEGGTPRQAMAFHDELFDRQPAVDGAPPSDAELEAWAVDAGVAEGLVSDALKRPDSPFADAAVRSAGVAGIETVPTVLVDGRPFGTGTSVGLADQLQRKILTN